MKRRATQTVRGKGGHSPDHIPERRRPTGPVKPVISKTKHGKEMEYVNSIQRRAAAFRLFIIRAALIMLAVLGLAWRWQCNAQTHFRFDVAYTEFPDGTSGNGAAIVWAHADSLEIFFPNIPPGILSSNPIWFAGINWVWTDDGSKYYNSTERQISLKWSPGSDVRDQYLIIKSPALSATLYQRRRVKTDRL